MIRISKDLLASARAPPRSLSLPCPVALSSSQSLPAVFGSFGTSPGTPTITAKYHTILYLFFRHQMIHSSILLEQRLRSSESIARTQYST